MDSSEQPAISEVNVSKSQEWGAIVAEATQITDANGKPIDAGIFETVVGLIANGIPTIQSCEGHLDQGEMYPWVDLELETEEIKRLSEQYSNLDQQVEDLEIEGKVLEEELEERYIELNRMRRELEKIRAAESKKVYDLLQDYYEIRKAESIPYDQILVLRGSRLHHIGGSYQVSQTPEVQSTNLTKYQQDMKQFSAFLKKRFISS